MSVSTRQGIENFQAPRHHDRDFYNRKFRYREYQRLREAIMPLLAAGKELEEKGFWNWMTLNLVEKFALAWYHCGSLHELEIKLEEIETAIREQTLFPEEQIQEIETAAERISKYLLLARRDSTKHPIQQEDMLADIAEIVAFVDSLATPYELEFDIHYFASH